MVFSRSSLARSLARLAALAALAVVAAGARPVQAQVAPDPADAIVAAIADPQLKLVLEHVLARNPSIGVARARAFAAGTMPAQLRPLPDPMLMATWRARTDDMERAMIGLRQEVPLGGKRGLRAEAASLEAVAMDASVEATRLRVVTEAREVYHEIGFLDATERIIREEIETLRRFDELARSRYAAGSGMQEDAVKIQAEITRKEIELIGLDSARRDAVAALNALRADPWGSLGRVPLGSPAAPPEATGVQAIAMSDRPEIAMADARIAAARVRVELARKEGVPDLTLQGDYGIMGGMGSGLDNDEITLGAGINLPVHRGRIAAGIDQAVHEQAAAVAERAAIEVALRRDAAQITARLSLTERQLRLHRGVLAVQADEALRSAESAYATGMAGSLELLDAERVLFEVRLGTARAQADLLVLAARLEGVLARPVRREGGAS